MRNLILAAIVVASFGCNGESPTAPSPPPAQPPVAGPPPTPTPTPTPIPAPPRNPFDCVVLVSKSWSPGSDRRLDFVDVRYVFRNNCAERIRFSGRRISKIKVEVYDNASRSGTPIGSGWFDSFEIAGRTTATIEDLVILDRGSIDDISSPDAVVMFADVLFV